MKIEIKKIRNTSYFPSVLGAGDPLDMVIQWHIHFTGWIGWIRINKGFCILREDCSSLTMGQIQEKVEDIIRNEFMGE